MYRELKAAIRAARVIVIAVRISDKRCISVRGTKKQALAVIARAPADTPLPYSIEGSVVTIGGFAK